MMIKQISLTQTTVHSGLATLENIHDTENLTMPQAVTAPTTYTQQGPRASVFGKKDFFTCLNNYLNILGNTHTQTHGHSHL